jgi:hypothetical protein
MTQIAYKKGIESMLVEERARTLEVDMLEKERLQQVLNIIRDFVLSQTQPFTIAHLYMNPFVSEKLAVTKANLLMIDKALMTLNCSTVQNGFNTPFKDLLYVAPPVKRVHRDLVCL